MADVVAPFTGAWIETAWPSATPPLYCVAPFTGAWIETELELSVIEGKIVSLPSRERGLKPGLSVIYSTKYTSLPSRERGLKHRAVAEAVGPEGSLPSRERGLKRHMVTGLKPVSSGRSLHGSVD